MPEHIPAGGSVIRDSHGNRTYKERRPVEHPPDVRKVPADCVPYGDSICTRGKHVWAAYDGDELIAVAATAHEARKKWRVLMTRKRAREQAAKRNAENLET